MKPVGNPLIITNVRSYRDAEITAATVALAAALSVSAFWQTTYNALNDFSLKSNPNGPWSYLYNNAPMMTAVSNGTIPGLVDWQGAIISQNFLIF